MNQMLRCWGKFYRKILNCQPEQRAGVMNWVWKQPAIADHIADKAMAESLIFALMVSL